MKTLLSMRGRSNLFTLINILVIGMLLFQSQTSEPQVRHNIPALQISKFSMPETRKPTAVPWTLCACMQRWMPQTDREQPAAQKRGLMSNRLKV